ncbi:MerR family transcriptional regulator [Haematobacter missouriensis]|uniref:MerR family transcriptional regulator n=1 Tax=Haematobacter missouriensis TaxID=366616 RepID=UPI003C6DA20B
MQRAIHSPPVSLASARDETGRLMTIGEMCAAFDVTPRTLRFYESKELLSPLREGQTRWFTRRDRGRLKLILRGKRFGFSLEEMRQLLDLYDRDGSQITQLSRPRDVAAKRLDDLERRRAELDEAIAELKEEIAWADDVLAGGPRDLTAAQ